MTRIALVISLLSSLALSASAAAGEQKSGPPSARAGEKAKRKVTPPPGPVRPDPADVEAKAEAARREAERARREREHTLSREEIEYVVFAHELELGDCYRAHALRQSTATGEMRLDLIISRDGWLFRLDVVAPGVKGKRLEQCVRKVAESWQFPLRKGFTTAIVPFKYIRTRIPGAGPYKSCWNPRGCPRPRAP